MQEMVRYVLSQIVPGFIGFKYGDDEYIMSKDYKLFEIAFIRQLEKESKISNFVEQFGKYQNVVLLCSEPTNQKCHRRVVSEMLLSKFNKDIVFGGSL